MNRRDAKAVIRLLERAKGFIERGWTRGAYARDENGDGVGSRNPTAVCWCAAGALSA